MPDIIPLQNQNTVPSVTKTPVQEINSYLSSRHQQVVDKPKFSGAGVLSGAASGASFGGVPGAFVGGALGLASDVFNFVANNNSYKHQVTDNRKNAATDYARQRELMKDAQDWNSEQAQVSRLKSAGLSPALSYSQLSSSSVSVPSSSQAQSAVSQPSNVRFDEKLLGFYNLQLQNKAIESQILKNNADIARSQSETASNDINNKSLDTRNMTEIMKMVQEIKTLKSSEGLNDQNKENLSKTLDFLIDKLTAEATNLRSSAALSDVKQGTEKSLTSLNYANSRYVSGVQTDKANQDIAESKTRQTLQQAQRDFAYVQTQDLIQKYNVDSDELEMIMHYIDEYDLPKGSEKLIIDAAHNMAAETGKSIPQAIKEIVVSWTSGTTWLPYLSSEHRTDVIERGQDQRYEIEKESNEIKRESNDIKRESNEIYRRSIDHDDSGKPNSKPSNSSSGSPNLHESSNYSPEQNKRIDLARNVYQKLSDENKNLVREYSKNHTSLQCADYTISLYNQQSYQNNN